MNSTDLALGLRAYTGWAVAITLGIGPSGPMIIDRRRIALQDPGLPGEVYHVAHSLEADVAAGLIAQAIEASQSAAFEGLTALMGDISKHGLLARAGIVVGKGPPRPPPPHARMSHTGFHASEGQLYRHTLIQAAERARLELSIITEPELLEAAAATLGLAPAVLTARVTQLGASVGPPWTQREKSAALAAWMALARS